MRAVEKKWDLNEINFTRKCVGLPPLKGKNKRCSKCSSMFVTTSHDICCDSCRRQNQSFFEYCGVYGDKNSYV
ncbi:MAG: hypothetical protein V4591_01620 [Bdellovibrionota bacterium]